ncbi:MAG: hypothetical protein HYV07_17445 [Deltaproteobacteria bacterium]|nr:hypothetical protein [Deltaproteobacteria bacterium]
MSSWSLSAAKWVKQLFSNAPQSRFAGEPMLAVGDHALVATEVLISTAIHHATSEGSARHRPDGIELLNAFGAPVEERFVESPRGAMAAASGVALSGHRASAFLPGDRLAQIQDQLFAAVGHRVPIVVHADGRAVARHGRGAGTGHETLHALAQTGALVAIARDVQHAVDLTIAARRISELSLTPVVVAADWLEVGQAVESVRMIDRALVREYLGLASEDIEAPTPSQRLVFGGPRRRVPIWFDLDRPVAQGATQGGGDFGRAAASQALLFDSHAADLLARALDELSKLTGRTLSSLSTHKAEGARAAIVVMGSTAGLAARVADELGAHGKKVGVVGIEWLRPFPTERLVAALANAEAVTVLERADDPLTAGGPLFREVQTALAGAPTKVLSAVYGLGGQAVTAAEVAEVFSNTHPKGRPHTRVGVTPPLKSRFPRRQVLVEAVAREYPRIADSAISATQVLDVRPTGARSVGLLFAHRDPDPEVLRELATALDQPFVRARWRSDEPGLWGAQAVGCDVPFRDSGDETLLSVLLVSTLELTASLHPLDRIERNGALVLSSPLTGIDLWTAIPEVWRSTIVSRGIRVFVAPGGLASLLLAGKQLIKGEAELERIDWSTLPAVEPCEAELPLVVRRRGKMRESYDNVPRFFGEFYQPRARGEAAPMSPDPFSALGVIPAATASFHDATAGRTTLPRLNLEKCTGCSRCWTSCPDSAMSPLLLSTEAWLAAAAENAQLSTEGVAGKLKRALGQLASHVERLARASNARTITPPMLVEAFEALADKMKLVDDDRRVARAALDAVAQHATIIPNATPPWFFHDVPKGSAEVLTIAINPSACQGCGGCAAVCGEEAIGVEPQVADRVSELRRGWSAWERLPDTSGAAIARVSKLEGVGPLGAVMLSRHCLSSLTGGEGAEPGSGERLATRLVTAVVEHEMQTSWLSQVKTLDGLAAKLREALDKTIAKMVPTDDLAKLARALEAMPSQPANGDKLLSALKELGERTTVDRVAAQRLVSAARSVEGLRKQLAEGLDGLGRARFGVLVAGESVSQWTARFPRNPFSAPVSVDLAGSGPDLAFGLMQGLMRNRLEESRLLRWVELVLRAPSDLPAAERAIEKLTEHHLTPEERALCAPLVVLGGRELLAQQALAGLSRLLSSDLPAKVVLLDDCDRFSGVDPAMLAMSHRSAFVLATSIAHPSHLFDGVTEALRFAGPALVLIHAPSPRRHGFPTDSTVARARLAVECRVHPLLRYDPRRVGVFGQRLSLAGNPFPERVFAEDDRGKRLTPANWAVAETRFSEHFFDPPAGLSPTPVADWPNLAAAARELKLPTIETREGSVRGVSRALARGVVERAEHWRMLTELAGVVTPFIDDVQTRLEAELETGHKESIAELERKHAQDLAELEARNQASQAERLHKKLMQLVTTPRSNGRDLP